MGSGVCHGDGEKILYAWGRNAPKLKLPPGKSVPFEFTTKQTFICKIYTPPPSRYIGSPVINSPKTPL